MVLHVFPESSGAKSQRASISWAEMGIVIKFMLFRDYLSYFARVSEICGCMLYLYICIWVFPKMIWYPQIIHFNRVFHYTPSILGYPYSWKHPYIYIYEHDI